MTAKANTSHKAEPSRFDALFKRLATENRKAFVTFAIGCDPDFDESLAALHAFVAAGIDIIELGYPFSDPILDGATIQAANWRGLGAGGNLARTLDMVAAFRETNTTTPVILMGYTNPLAVMGYTTFAARAAKAGVDGIIAADMPLREADDMLAALAGRGMVMIPRAATTLDEKDFATRHGVGGFLYCIPVVGPTGGPSARINATAAAIERCRETTALPVLVGFGIKTPEAAAATAALADGVIVASALIDMVQADAGSGTSADRRQSYTRHISAFRDAIDRAVPVFRPWP